MRLIGRLAATLFAVMSIAMPAQARVDAAWAAWFPHGSSGGGGSCPFGTTYPDGCKTGSTFQQTAFFGGYANQSFGQSYSGITNLQPASYSVRAPWNVAGVDYPVGVPAGVTFKDPAQIGTDALANPDGNNTDCIFYSSTVGNPSGTPAPNNGPEVYCSKAAPSAILIQGYNFGSWNFIANPSSTGHDCVFLVIKGNTWPSVTIDSNQFVNGMNCNSNGGGNNPQDAEIYFVSGNAFPKTYTNNTFYGCGGPSPFYGSENRYSAESAVCNPNFVQGAGTFTYTASISGTSAGNMTVSAVPAGSGQGPIAIGQTLTVPGCTGSIVVQGYSAGSAGATGAYTVSNPNGCSVTNVTISSYSVQATGVAPYDNRVALEYTDGNTTIEYNAMIHQPGHFSNGATSCGGFTHEIHYNYTEAMGYIHGGTGAAVGIGEHAEFVEMGDTCAGSHIIHDTFNTYLLTAAENGGDTGSLNPEGGEANFYFSAGGNANYLFLSGYVNNDVFVTNLSPFYSFHWTTKVAAVAMEDNDFTRGVTVNNNYMDPTGTIYCVYWDQDVSGGVISLSGNKSLLGSAGDASANVLATRASPTTCYGSQ